jgi:hypothetical protein
MKRRSFLHTSTPATARAFTAKSDSQIAGTSKRVRAGIIGFGLSGDKTVPLLDSMAGEIAF